MVEYSYFTDIGTKRANEDALIVCANDSLDTVGFALADGLGGYGFGDVAATFVVDCFAASVENAPEIDDGFLAECFDTAQRLLMEEKELKGLSSIKTTLVLLTITGKHARWGHVGDSRLYHFRHGRLLERTLDHSIPQMLVRQRKIKEKEIRFHPERNRLTRAMGAEWDEPCYEIRKRGVRVRPGDWFLLCSDGFWEWIDEKAMSGILKKGLAPDESLNRMVEIIRNNAGECTMDNLSAILVSVT